MSPVGTAQVLTHALKPSFANPYRGPEGPLLQTKIIHNSSEDVFHLPEQRPQQRLVVDLGEHIEFLQ